MNSENLRNHFNQLNYRFSVLINDNNETDMRNVFSAENPINAKSIVLSQNPMPIASVQKYFKTEDDLESLKNWFLEIPKIYTFDQVYSPQS